MSEAAWKAYEIEFKTNTQSIKERDEAEQKLDEALLEIKRLEDIVTKNLGYGFTPYVVRKGLR